MFKPERFLLLCAVLAGLLSACGSPATQAPTFVPTQALPTRVPVIEPTRPGAANATAAPTTVAAQPTMPPTAAPTNIPATPTITLIPASPTSLPATATMNMPATATMSMPATAAGAPAGAGAGDATRGEALFKNGTGDAVVLVCSSCHNVDTDDVKVGPSLKGVATHGLMHAQQQGQDISTYLHNSILHPNDFIVPNVEGHVFSAGPTSLMYQDYAKHLTPQQVDDLVAYLLTLK